MNQDIKAFVEALRNKIGGTDESADTVNLHLTRDEFKQKMLLEYDGQALLDLLETGEWRVCERLGLCNGYYQDGIPYIDVPRWNNLVVHLRTVNRA